MTPAQGASAEDATTLPRMRQPGPRPLAPRLAAHTVHFWQELQAGRFALPRCEGCARLTFPPKVSCPACGSLALGWQTASGAAIVYSATTVHAAPGLFAALAPYTLAVLDLVEGARLVTRWVGEVPARCGMAAQLVVIEHDDGVLFGATAKP